MSVNDARMFVFAQGDELLDINGSLVDGDGDYAGIMSVIGHLDEDYEWAKEIAKSNNASVLEMVEKPKPIELTQELADSVEYIKDANDISLAITVSDLDNDELRKVLRGYLDGYVVKGAQKYHVFVPGVTNCHKMYVKANGGIDTEPYIDGPLGNETKPEGMFTMAEIKDYGLYAFDREKVDD